MWRLEFDPWVGRIPWRRDRLPTAVFWPGEFCGLYSPWGRKESDMTKQLKKNIYIYTGPYSRKHNLPFSSRSNWHRGNFYLTHDKCLSLFRNFTSLSMSQWEHNNFSVFDFQTKVFWLMLLFRGLDSITQHPVHCFFPLITSTIECSRKCILFKILISIFGYMYPEVRLLDHMVLLFFIFQGTSIIFGKAVPFYILTHSV